MRTGIKMTIQDYFKRSGIPAAPSPKKTSTITNNGLNADSFSKTFAAVQSSKPFNSDAIGLSIRDYVARPVPAKTSLRTFPMVPPHPVMPDPSGSESPSPSPDAVQPGGTDQSRAANMAGTETVEKIKFVEERDKILDSIDKAARKYNIPKSLIRAVVQAESDYRVRAVSPAGAQGLMQLMPATARELGVKNPFDVDQNIDGGTKYLRQMLDRFDGDTKTALSAYNAGPGTVAKYGGDVPYTETRNYVERVMRYSRQFS